MGDIRQRKHLFNPYTFSLKLFVSIAKNKLYLDLHSFLELCADPLNIHNEQIPSGKIFIADPQLKVLNREYTISLCEILRSLEITKRVV